LRMSVEAEATLATLRHLTRYNCDCLPNGPDGKTMATDDEAKGDDVFVCQRWVILADDLDAALAGAGPTPPPSGWQPIETAPKDGTELLLTDGRYKRTGYWARRIEAWSVDMVPPVRMPTHWMPLPEGPTHPQEPT
jgi:hypothetical protein